MTKILNALGDGDMNRLFYSIKNNGKKEKKFNLQTKAGSGVDEPI